MASVVSNILQRIDAVPLQGNEGLTFELQRWLSTLVDTLNTTLEEIEFITVPYYPLTDVAQQAIPNTGYVPGSSSLTTITLPTEAEVGSKVAIQGQGSGGWLLQANTGQVIHLSSGVTSDGGSIASSNQYDTIIVMCIEANSVWSVSWFVSIGGLVVT
jgi:hypothetical protein